MKRLVRFYFSSWWLPALSFFALLGCFAISAIPHWHLVHILPGILFTLAVLALIGVLSAAIWNLIQKRWIKGVVNILLLIPCAVVTLFAFGFLMLVSIFGPSEDGFADNLTIPEDIDISKPESPPWGGSPRRITTGTDSFQNRIREALAIPGSDDPAFVASLPSLRIASTEYRKTLLDYLDASPDWHVFFQQGNRFASRRWHYAGEPRDTLHGYISEFGGESKFQTRTLLCLDRKQWSRYSVQFAEEGTASILPGMRRGNALYESRVMLDCGGVWLEIFEQSDAPERRVTKATLRALEQEFSVFLADPLLALADARSQSHELATRNVDPGAAEIRLFTGMQPGIYSVVYTLNPQESGSVYLRAYEVTQGTPLSVNRLQERSMTRMTWSPEPLERFTARSGFTIYEGDWGKPYAARFEAWFIPDSGAPERQLAERIFKIEGWQR